MRKVELAIIIMLLVTVITSCSGREAKSSQQDENVSVYSLNECIQKIEQMEKTIEEKNMEIDRLTAEIGKINKISVNYVSYGKKRRFVEKTTDLLMLPYDGAKAIRQIKPNTVTDVEFAGISNDNNLWLFVIIPTYDSPSDNRGWIKEADTVAYTSEMQSKVQSDVTVREGTEIFEIVNDVKDSEPKKLNYNVRGRITQRDGNMVRLFCPGALEFWVNETHIIYPEVE